MQPFVNPELGASDVSPPGETRSEPLRGSHVPPVGFEPTTVGLKVHCANQLRYGGMAKRSGGAGAERMDLAEPEPYRPLPR